MERKSFTIIFVPHARAKFRKLQVTNYHLWSALALILLLATASTLVFWLHFTSSVDGSKVARLQDENEELRHVNRSIEDSIRDLEVLLADYEERTRRLAIVAGLEELGGYGESGIGGLDLALDSPAEGLELVANRATSLADRLDSVEVQLEEHLRWISSVPAIMPTRGLFTSTFGPRRDPLNGRRSFHQGIDISAPPGSPVRAPADGVVVLAARHGGLGNAIFLSHGFGLATRYGHMSRLAVKPGDRVRRGDVIGYVGNTGRSTGYHLHYEVHLDGQPVNPLAYILDRPNRRP
jgi:murein DD-endopeptidase MepM/ murein hydrolase activator NlpD